MKNKAILIVIVLLVLGGAAFYYFSRMKGGTAEQPGGEVVSGARSLKELIATNTPQKCTYSSKDDLDTSEGTTYIAGGKVRGDFTNTVSGKTTVSHMITDGKTSYIWTEGEKNGLKMTVEETEAKDTGTSDGSTEKTAASQTDFNEKMNYKCSGWVLDNSFFTPPANVTFTDFSEMFKTVPSAGTSGQVENSSACSACDSLSGDDKTQCLTALKCQ